jgi:uroporphyrin-3 C-methyltransferase
VNEPVSSSSAPEPAAATAVVPRPSHGLASPGAPRPALRLLAVVAIAVALLGAGALAVALHTQQRLDSLERDLVRRQQDAQEQAAEARMLSHQAQDAARDAAAKVALLDARVSEATLQRSQLEELIQSVSRSRDENVVSDVQALLQVAQQQSALTGSAEPLVAALKQADDRLARYDQPRLERVRRAIARDLDRTRAVGVIDIASLVGRLDEITRQVDELPLLSSAWPKPAEPASAASAAVARSAPRAWRGRHAAPPASSAASAPAAAPGEAPWAHWLGERWQTLTTPLWGELRSLLRVTRIDTPEAALVAPEQAYFLRENLKLRLLNARLALLSRQFDTAQADLHDAQATIERYFDRSSKRVAGVEAQLREVQAQARQVVVPRPDETLAALAVAAAGR